jgi:hypothetical protein
MESSRESTIPTDDGRTHQSDDHSGSGTNPVGPPHPTFGFLTLPGTSNVPGTTMEYRHAPIYLGSDKVPAQFCEPLSRTPSKEDVLMTERHLEEYVKAIEKDSEESRAAASPPVGDTFLHGNVERREGAFDMASGSETQGRRVSHTALTQSACVLKPRRSSSGKNEQSGITPRSLGERVRPRSGLRSQSTTLRSQYKGKGTAGGENVEGLQGGVDRMSINDEEA